MGGEISAGARLFQKPLEIAHPNIAHEVMKIAWRSRSHTELLHRQGGKTDARSIAKEVSGEWFMVELFHQLGKKVCPKWNGEPAAPGYSVFGGIARINE